MEHSESIAAIVKSLGKAQLAVGPIKRTTKNPFFGSMYADLTTVLDAIRKPLSDNGLVLMQTTESDGGQVSVKTLMYHIESGEWLKSSLVVTPKDPTNPQVLGAVSTYLRRYAIPGFLMVASEDDDDGNSAASSVKPDPKKADKQEKAPDPAPKGTPGKISAGQLKFVQTLFTRAGYKEDIDKHAYATGVANRTVTSISDLTSKEAHAIIEALQKLTGAVPAL